MQHTIDILSRTIRCNPKRVTDTAEVAEMLTFESRDDYLAWVAEWKRLWHELVRQIRSEKVALRAPHTYPESAVLMSRRVVSRSRAHAMLLLRVASKEAARARRRSIAA